MPRRYSALYRGPENRLGTNRQSTEGDGVDTRAAALPGSPDWRSRRDQDGARGRCLGGPPGGQPTSKPVTPPAVTQSMHSHTALTRTHVDGNVDHLARVCFPIRHLPVSVHHPNAVPSLVPPPPPAPSTSTSSITSCLHRARAALLLLCVSQEEVGGTSAMMQAAAAGQLESVKLLLMEGAPWNATDRSGKCAGDHAVLAAEPSQPVIDSLVAAGVQVMPPAAKPGLGRPPGPLPCGVCGWCCTPRQEKGLGPTAFVFFSSCFFPFKRRRC